MEDFEKLALFAKHEEMPIWPEFLFGRLGFKVPSYGIHAEILRWLTQQLLSARSDLRLCNGTDIEVEKGGTGRAHADGVLALDGALAGYGNWVGPAVALMVVEITSNDADTDQRIRAEKVTAYAEAGIPVYLLIDRDDRDHVVHYAVEDEMYTRTIRRKFGRPLELPDPVGLTLQTEELGRLTLGLLTSARPTTPGNSLDPAR
ncbi:Uma2 family endonuclease [Nocardia alni]|uniref:Uma2 family endonuclease n=1 Tax=Nocardia alni TaxID=2815723 RepID=UPI001C23C4C4|nr:Uma2 family endonuclease [Nocardia alni]